MSIVVFALGCAACATSVGELKPNASSSMHDAEVLQLARERMQEAFVRLEQKIRDCGDNLRMTTVVSPTVIPKLSLSERDWGTALLYLSNRATTRCEGNAWGEALLAYTRFRDFEKRITGGNATDTSPYDLDALCCISEFGVLKNEVEYRRIAPEIRQQLESIPELNQPFNPIKTFEAMRR
jgi:hypothetical protein